MQLIDGVIDHLPIERFCHEQVYPTIVCLFSFDGAVVGGDHDYLDLGIVLLNVGYEIQAETIRQMIIEEKDTGCVILKRQDCIGERIHKAG